VVEEYEDRFVRSVTVAVKMPSVIRFIRGLRRGPKVARRAGRTSSSRACPAIRRRATAPRWWRRWRCAARR
jgi:hypothetical protein